MSPPPTSVMRLSLCVDVEISSQDTATPWAAAFRDDKCTFAYLSWLTGLQAPFALHAWCLCPGAGRRGGAVG